MGVERELPPVPPHHSQLPPAHLQGVDAGSDIVVCLLTEGCQGTRVGLQALPEGDLQETRAWLSTPFSELHPVATSSLETGE